MRLPKNPFAKSNRLWYNVERHYTRRSAHRSPTANAMCEAYGIMSRDIIRAEVRIGRPRRMPWYRIEKKMQTKNKEDIMKTVISTDKAPAAIGPYSQAIEVNGMVYTSGIIPVVPETGEIPEGSAAQAKQALTNLSNLLEAAGTSMDNVIKTTVFIKEMNDFGAINEVYATFFSGAFPARSCVEVARLPKDVMLEIEAIAIK